MPSTKRDKYNRRKYFSKSMGLEKYITIKEMATDLKTIAALISRE
jgi:hypothetical protein